MDLQSFKYTYIHTYIHIPGWISNRLSIHTYIHTNTLMDLQSFKYTYIHTYIQMCIHFVVALTYHVVHTMPIYIHTHDDCIHTYIHTYILCQLIILFYFIFLFTLPGKEPRCVVFSLLLSTVFPVLRSESDHFCPSCTNLLEEVQSDL